MASTRLDGSTLKTLISAAVAAPSIHNTQPWRYRLDPDTTTLEVHAATDRSLRHTDARGRALHLSVGAALFNLRLAVARAGFEPVVDLIPRPSRPDLLATVRLRAGTGGSEPVHLYDQIWRRHSSRLPFSEQRLPAGVVAELADAATAEGASLWFPGEDETARLLKLTAAAEQRNEAVAERRAESRGWVRAAGRDGIDLTALGPQDSRGRLPMRAFAGPGPGGRPPPAAFEHRPAIALLGTGDDRRVDWLRAGQALERVLLTATGQAVRTSLLYQAIEWPDLRGALHRRPDGVRHHPQMLVRLGYGPEGAATPRRPLDDVLIP